MKYVLTMLSMALLGLPCLNAGEPQTDWLQWRGPNRNGAVENVNPPIAWDTERNIKWKVELPGKGNSTPIIAGDRILILTAIETDRKPEGAAGERQAADEATANRPRPDAQTARPAVAGGEPGREGQAREGQAREGQAREGQAREGQAREGQRRGGPGRGGPGRGGPGRGGFGGAKPTNFYQFALVCLDRRSGKELWRSVAVEEVPHEAGHPTNTFASSSPVTDGHHIFVSFGSRGIFCFDMDGNKVWEKQLGKMQTRAGFGEGSSPALAGETLIVPWDHEGESFVLALDAKTGEEIWRTAREERTTWGTPLVVEHAGSTQVIMNGNWVRSYDLKSGELIWECGGQVDNPIPSPLLLDSGICCMTGYRGNAIHVISLDSKGDVSDSDMILWSRDDAAPYVPSPVLYKNRIYFTKSNNGILSSLDAATGEPAISQERLPDIRSIYASPVAAADRIYITSREGTTVVLKHGDELEVLAINKLEEPIDASPAIVGDEIFLRGEKHLFCISAN